MASNPTKCFLFGGSTILITLCGLFFALWPAIYDKVMQSSLELTNSSLNYKMWKKTPIPMYIEFTMYHWVNPQDVYKPGVKPKFIEKGPYVFSEVHERVNITWPSSNLIQFNQTRTYRFIPEMSNGSLSDKITSINVIAASTAYSMRFHTWGLLLVEGLFKITKTKLAITRTVNQWLFEGFDDPIINLINKVNTSGVPHIPFDKFGWFYNRNGSSSYDGRFEMYNGRDSLYNLGLLTKWNGVNQTKYYDSYCGMVNGTTGELWPPMNNSQSAVLFTSDLCRSLKLEYSGKKDFKNLEGNYYVGGDHLLDNGTKYPENKCFCGSGNADRCLPSGVANISSCKFGAPAFISYPRFYLADKFYTDAIDIPPATSQDMFTVLLEPITGVPLDVEAKLQINIHMRSYKTIGIFRDIKEALIPCFWFNQKAVLTDNLTNKLHWLLKLPLIVIVSLSILSLIGIIIFTSGVYMALWGHWSIKRKPEDMRVLVNEEDNYASTE